MVMGVIVSIAVVISLSAGGFWYWSGQQVTAATAAYKTAIASKAKRDLTARIRAERATAAIEEAAAAAAAQKSDDAFWASQGYNTAGNGIYFKAAAAKDVTCGYFNCAYEDIYTTNACPSGIYVAASIMNNGVSVGSANGITGGLTSSGSASLLLQDTVGQTGDEFHITDMHCLG